MERAKDQIIEFVESDSFVEFSNKPRIILCSEGFSQEITATVLWLRESDIDISCVKITPYQVGAQIVIVPKVVIPLEEARQYLIDIKRKEEVKELSVRKSRPKRGCPRFCVTGLPRDTVAPNRSHHEQGQTPHHRRAA